MKRGRHPLIQSELENDELVQTLNEMREVGSSWRCIAEHLGVSTSWLLNWRKNNHYQDPIEASDITDAELDSLIEDIQRHHPDRGETMVIACVAQSGVRVSRDRIRQSIHRVNPDSLVYRQVSAPHRVVYNVKGPHRLWHVNGNHALIDFGIAVEAGIDVFSRACVFIEALTKYDSSIVLKLFTDAVEEYTLPSRVSTDKGTENIKVAEYMIRNRGLNRESIITEKTTLNQRIVRFWIEVRKEVLNFYLILFNSWVNDHFLNFNTMRTKFVIHSLFMDRINADLQRFRHTWNNHSLRTEHNKTPNQLLYFNQHLIKEAPSEISEDEYGATPYDIEIEPRQEVYEAVLTPFTEAQLAFFRCNNPPLQLCDTSIDVMWQRTERGLATYDYLISTI